MQNTVIKNEKYLNHLQSAVTSFKSGQYAAVLSHLYEAKQTICDVDWKKDFGIMLSNGDDDFWSNLCILDLCCTGLEALCSNGCCSGCCGLACAVYCCASCCHLDPGSCLFDIITVPIECCWNCCCE